MSNQPLDFFIADNDFIEFLQSEETKARGFTRVPNNEYDQNRKPKFYCGIVLTVNDKNYFVPVTSYTKQKPDNLLIMAPNGKILSSLRFNYMVPMPVSLVKRRDIASEPDPKHKRLLIDELAFCRKNSTNIRSMAERTYRRVLSGHDKGLIHNSCDFLLLEEKCTEYCAKHNLSLN
jgi:protein AbiQ